MSLTNSKVYLYRTRVLSGLDVHMMSRNDFEIVRDWCINEGWNLGIYDSLIYYQTDRNGHFLFYDKEIPIGSLSLVKHSENFFTVGPFIVRKEFRGNGVGEKIWGKALTRMRSYKNASIMLYAVSAQVNRYKKYGFQPKYKNLRWNLTSHQSGHLTSNISCKRIKSEILNKIIPYDQKIFIANRGRIFTEILKYPIKGFFIEDDNKLKGYGLIRPCLDGFRIGPLYADTQEIAKSILIALLKEVDSEKVIIDIPEGNPESASLMEEFKGKRNAIYDTVAMFKGNYSLEYDVNLTRNYGIFSLEIG